MMKNKYIPLGLLLLAALLLTLGCSKRDGSFMTADSAVYYEKPAMMPVMEAAGGEYMFGRSMMDKNMLSMPAPMPAAVQESDAVERKLTMRASITIRVENLDIVDSSVKNMMEKYGAYAASTVTEENLLIYSLRVPSSDYAFFLAELDSMGRVLNRSESAEDVTLRFYDLEGRLASQRELLATFQSYLRQAKNIEEILSVEARINQLQNELEGTGRELRNLSSRIDYATIDLTVQGPLASTPYRGPTLGERISSLFKGFGSFLSTTVIVLIGIVIFGIPILLLLILVYWLLFGKVGLLKKLWRIAAGRKQ